MSVDKDHSRRTFLKIATAAMGGVIGFVAAIPLVRYFLYPVGRTVVDNPDAPVDVIAAGDLVAGGPPVRVKLRVSGVRNAWAVATDQGVGSAWLSKDAGGKVTAFSASCPHLGCSIGFDPKAGQFACPCHKSAFDRGGQRLSGPAKRGLDPLPTRVVDGRVQITFKRFVQDIAERREA